MLGEGDDERDKEVGLLCGDPTSESVGRGALALPSEGSRVGPLLSRRSLGLGGEEGRGESVVGRSSSGGDRLPAKGGGGERRVRGGHTERRHWRRGRGGRDCGVRGGLRGVRPRELGLEVPEGGSEARSFASTKM